MKKLIIICLFIIGSFQLSAVVWQRVDGPYDETLIFCIFEFNNELYASSREGWPNYILNANKWELSELNLPNNKPIENFKQQENVVIFSTVNELFLSTDYGFSWKNIRDDSIGFFVNGIKEFVITDNRIYPQAYNGFPRKLYQYSLESNKWDTVLTKNNETVYSDKVVIDNEYIYSASYGYPGALIPADGFFISNDRGDTWEKSDFDETKFKTLVLHNNILFASGVDSNLYTSIDHGKTWEVNSNNKMAIDFFYSEGNNLFAAVNKVGIRLSTDNGITWEKRHEGIEGSNIKDLISYKNMLYVENAFKKIFKSSNEGKEWEKCEILTDSLSYISFLNYGDTLLVSYSISTKGLQYITKENTNWQKLGNGFGSQIGDIYKRDSVIICKNQTKRSFLISTDYGQNWTEYGVGNLDPTYAYIQNFEVIGGDTILVTTIFGSRFSTDYGKSWSKFHTEVLDSNFDTRNIVRLDDNTLIIVARNEGLFKSEDNGQTWGRIPTEFLTIQSTIFNTFEYHNGRIYAFLPETGLFYSEDEGITWKEFNKEFSEKGSDQGIVFYGDYVIISSEDGILVSNDDGKSATYYEIEKFAMDDSFDSMIRDIAIHHNNLYVASYIGIYKIKLSDLGIEKITSVESETERNYLYTYPPYPLPTKSEVKVLFYWDINLPMSVSDISIYDLNGQKIPTRGNLRLEKQESHYGNLIWDCSSAQSGVYIISIKHGTEEKSVKVIKE